MKKKKLAAAIAAVTAYIKTSEEAAACYASPYSTDQLDPMIQQVVQQVIHQITPVISQQITQHVMQLMAGQQPFNNSNTWGTSGRQSQMQDNSLMQKRTFK